MINTYVSVKVWEDVQMDVNPQHPLPSSIMKEISASFL